MAKLAEKPATDLVTTSPQVDPRVRMKEIRAEVAMYLKGDSNPAGISHLGELPDNMEDARRVIVALQDLFEKEKTKHRKATDHVCELVHLLDFMADYQNDLVQLLTMQQQQISNLELRLQSEEKHGYHMRDQMRESQRERDAVLTTIKLMNNIPSSPLTPYGEELSMSMVMGHSNRDRG